ncbi:MAG: 4Fe-4S ferredoxin iron-sulfur binding domain protein, partial [Methanohalophilus sp.]
YIYKLKEKNEIKEIIMQIVHEWVNKVDKELEAW